jgi:hypothetical protein
MSGCIGSAIAEFGKVEKNVGAAAETTSPALSFQKLFLLPVSVADIFGSRCRPNGLMSGQGV